MDEQKRRVRRCLACDTTYPTACGVCTSCGAPPLTGTDDDPYQVVVPEIPSMKQRGTLADELMGILDCPIGAGALTEKFGKGNTILCSDLSRASAQSLVDFLQRMHVSAKIESPSSAAGGRGSKLFIAGAVTLGVGIVLGLVLSSFLLWTIIGLVAGGAIAGVGLIQRSAPTKAMCLAPAPPHPLKGWESMPAVLARLLGSLAGAPRDALSAVATHVAAIQDDIASESIASYAAGGPGGPFDNAVGKLLVGAVSLARRIADGAADDELVKRLDDYAKTAHQARKRYGSIGDEASSEAGTSGEAPDAAALAAEIEKELSEASDAMASLN